MKKLLRFLGLFKCLIGRHDMETTSGETWREGDSYFCWETKYCRRCIIWGFVSIRQIKIEGE